MRRGTLLLPATVAAMLLAATGVALSPDNFHADYFNSEDLERLVQMCIREGRGATAPCGAQRGSAG